MTEAEPTLREVVLPGVREYLQMATVVLKYVQRRTQDNPNGEVIIVYHKQGDNNAGSGAAENATIVDAYSQKFGRSTIPTKQLYKRVRWTGKVIKATQSSKDALIDAVVSETEYGVKDFKTSLNRQLNGDERDALGFYVSGAGSGTAVVTDQWLNVGADFFRSGTTLVDLIDGSTNTVRQSGLTATRGAIVATGRNIAVSPNLTGAAVAGDYFVLSGTIGQQLVGLRAVVSAGNPPLQPSGLQGVPVASVPEFAATIVGSDGADKSAWVDLKFENMQRVLSEIDLIADEGAEGIELILTSHPGQDTYVKMCKDDSITINNMTLDGGFKGVSFNGTLPLVRDKHVRRGAFQFLNFNTFGLYQLADIDWADLHGSMFEKVPNKDVYEAMLFQYAEFGTDIRNGNGELRGINMIY